MRPLPIPVMAPSFPHATPWWRERNHAPSFSDVFRAFFPSEEAPKGLQLGAEASWMELRILVIQWVQITYVRRVQTGTFHSSGMPPKAPPPPPPRDPLVIDLDGTGVHTSGATGAHFFDLTGKGQPRLTSFVKGNSAFLALDRNGNGHIDSGAELFGDQHGALDGYEELRKFDLNADGQIDAQDPVFSRLKLLFGDGRLTSLTDASIRAFTLQASHHGGQTEAGDPIFRQATALTTHGGTLNSYALGLNQFNPSPTSATLGPVPP